MRVFPGRWLALSLCAMTMACTTRAMFVPPAGPGAPAPEAAAAWGEATAACRDARTYAAALRVSGRFGSERLWPIGIEAAVTTDQSIYLSATAVGRSVFVLSGSGNRATLWLRREERAVTAAPADIMNAIVGVPLAPDRLLAVLTGCVARSFPIVRAARYGRLLTIETADARVHLEQRGGRWRALAAETDAFTVKFVSHTELLPSDVWIWSRAGRGPAASLHMTVADPEINGDVPAIVFQVPPGAMKAAPLTLDELRAAGPWKDRGGPAERSPWPAP